jgi:pimeloyl-ACP methyl ester carboxylesterase
MARIHPRRWLAAVLVLSVGFLAARSFRSGAYGADAMMHPPRQAVERPEPGPSAAKLVDASFSSAGGGPTLRGWVASSTNGAAIVLVHGYGGNRTAVWPEARAFVARGYGVLLFDLQAHGESGGDRVTLGDDERNNVQGALDYLSLRGDVEPGKVGVFAFSMGGWAATPVAAADRRVRALVLAGVTASFESQEREGLSALSPYLAGERWELRKLGVDLARTSPVRFIGALAPRPVLLIRGSKDTTVPERWMLPLLAAAGEPKELWRVEGAGHGGYYEAEGDAYTARLVAFFDRALDVRTP